MDKPPRKQAKTTTSSTTSEEVSSIVWEFIKMTSQEEDVINRMYRLVGDRDLNFQYVITNWANVYGVSLTVPTGCRIISHHNHQYCFMGTLS
ncbi:MYB-like transcription factor ETC2 [Camellia sinensis]|uniref:MYB-like transcription factor ETC2 n=1 Tax=Camellia sinensis TaxID=4442 RepID=UPI001035F99D|nr:MYB-like transcription factor ETC2 [Camellia sinensis]